jgi:hypothetical protein
VPAQNISDSLVRDLVAEMGQSADDTVIAPAGIVPCHLHNQRLHFGANPRPARYERYFEPSNFCATSLWNHSRIVSGLATMATVRVAVGISVA